MEQSNEIELRNYIIELEKDYLVNVFGKKLIDSNEYNEDYLYLAKKYWPEEYLDSSIRKDVHHIDLNHFNNVVSNLVVLTCKEHRQIHAMLKDAGIDKYLINDESAFVKPVKLRKSHLTEEHKQKISQANKGRLKGRVSPNKGNKYSEETRRKMSESQKRQHLERKLNKK